jgi:hypothetical protein
MLLLAVSSVQIAHAEQTGTESKLNGYEVLRGPFNVGKGFIEVSKIGNKTKISYRMHIDVKVLGLQVYFLDSQQIALFDESQKLLFARTSADIDGKKHEVLIELSDNKETKTYKVTHNTETKDLTEADFSATTLTPTFSEPESGVWLDLTDTNLLKYEVTKKKDHFHLKRPDGEDELYLDSDKIMEKIISSLSIGSLTLKRKTTGSDALAFKAEPSRVEEAVPQQYLQ